MNLMTLILVISMIIAASNAAGKGGHCPLANSVSKCFPRCINDYDCPHIQKCCPNKCGNTSCAVSSPVNTGNDSKNSNTQLCDGVKCNSYQKCVLDRQTKRSKCMTR